VLLTYLGGWAFFGAALTPPPIPAHELRAAGSKVAARLGHPTTSGTYESEAASSSKTERRPVWRAGQGLQGSALKSSSSARGVSDDGKSIINDRMETGPPASAPTLGGDNGPQNGRSSAPGGPTLAANHAANRAVTDATLDGNKGMSGGPGAVAVVPSRCAPDFLLLGGRKGGTTSFFQYLTAHPSIDGPLPGTLAGNRSSPSYGEIHFFGGQASSLIDAGN